jgi:hypothetical protein
LIHNSPAPYHDEKKSSAGSEKLFSATIVGQTSRWAVEVHLTVRYIAPSSCVVRSLREYIENPAAAGGSTYKSEHFKVQSVFSCIITGQGLT